MRRLYNIVLTLMAVACQPQAWFAGGAAAQAAERVRYSIIRDPHDQRPGAITRSANDADRAWRKGRRSPEIVVAPQRRTVQPRPFEAPRYDGKGRRRNVPGRPDTYDQIGRSRALSRPTIVPSGPQVRTDAATRINQYPPR